MAVTVTDQRTILYQDGLTNITGASTSNTAFFAEATGSAAEAYNIATGQIYWSGTTPNFTTTGNELIYVWSAVVATQNGYKEATPANSSHAMYLSDGTNALLIYQAGNDRDVFKHADGQVSFQCFLVDIDYLSTMNTNGDLAVTAGTFASFNSASTSMDVGAHYTTLSKALGGGQNCFLDIIRYGGANQGLRITGGTTGDRGKFQEICVEDRSSADGKAHGIIREYTGGAYGVQGTLVFGTTGSSSWFDETGVSVTFEDRLVADDKFKFIVEKGAALGVTTNFFLRDSTIQSARPGVEVVMSSVGIDNLVLSAVTFLNLKNAFTLPTDTVTGSYNHTITNCTFNNVGIVYTGSTTMNNCTFSNAADPNGAVRWNTVTREEDQDNFTFNSGGTGHAIYIDIDTASTTTFNITGYTFDGYAGQSGTAGDRVFLINNPSDGAIVINLSQSSAVNQVGGGSGFSYELAAGTTSTVTINQTVTLTVTVVDTSSNPIEGARVRIEATSGGTLVTQGSTNASGVYSDSSYNYGGDLAVTIKVRLKGYRYFRTAGTITSNGISVGVTLQRNTIVDLP